ncbi:MAG: hypothetical protein MR051_02450 [Lentisphaeria bacterium]|nr:hypothetical protein [Lentisphaeria bacterium]
MRMIFGVMLFFLCCAGAEPVYETSFARGRWNPAEWKMLKNARSGYVGTWVQRDDRIVNLVPPGADIGSSWGTFTGMLLKRTFSGDIVIEAECGFEPRMAPGILIAPAPPPNEPEVTSLGEFFEVILYDHGFNCWHHYGENGVRKWYNAAKLLEKNLFAPGVAHTLTVKLFRRAGRRFLEVSGGGRTLGVCLPQMFSGDCRIGIAASEGVDFFRNVKISRL